MNADDDNNINNEGLEIAPSCVLDNIVTHNTSITSPILDTLIGNDHISSPGSVFREINGQYTCDVPVLMQYPVQQDSNYEKTNNQLPGDECRIDMAEAADEKNELDEHYAPGRRDRYSTSNNNSSDDQNEKSSSVTIQNQNAYFPLKSASLSNRWYLYRINMSNNNDLGFIVPCELVKLPKFHLYENDNALTVQLVYIGSVDYTECENQLKDFCQYIFEQVFDNMNTGLESRLKFDIEQSTFKLLPCLLKKSDELDYQRMASICERKNKVIQDRSELNDQEVYIRLNSANKQFCMSATAASLTKQTSDSWKNFPTVALKRLEKSNIDYLKGPLSPTNKGLNIILTKSEYCPIELLRYAPLNQPDCELIYKLPSILIRISQLSYIEQFRRLLADNIHSYSSLNVNQIPIVTFGDCLSQILSPNSSTALPLIHLNYDLLSANKCQFQPSPDLLFQSITRRSAAERTDMENLEILGDCFLKLAVSMSLYHRFPPDDIGKLTQKKSKEVSNENLYRLSVRKGLEDSLNSVKTIFRGEDANWTPPGYIIDEQNSERYLKQKAKPKAFADMIEALIGAFLISTDYITTIKFMKWLGLDVIPIDEQDGVIKIPSVLRIAEVNDINTTKISVERIYDERSFIDIETKIKYTFNNKAYLIAAFTHLSCSTNAVTINYKRLKFVGNALLQFLIIRYIFVTKKLITPGHITNILQDSLNNNQKANIILASDLYKKIIRTSPKLNRVSSNTTAKDFSTDENNISERDYSNKIQAAADVSEALIAAIFFDAGYCLETVWVVIDPLLRQYTKLDSSIENPTLNAVRLVHESGRTISNESNDDNGNFVCNIKLPDGTEVNGSGKSKRSARQSACKKVKK